MTGVRRLVFYRTVPIDDESRFGSGLRPAKLLRAFRRLGFEVDVVAGHAAERKAAIREVRRKIASGVEYDFAYAEPPTTPVVLNEPHHLPTHPVADYAFLSFLHSHRVPLVLFYCDVQWRLRDYARRVGIHKYLVMLPFFHLDLALYRHVVDALVVPDLGMVAQIPGWPASKPAYVSIPGFDPDERTPERPYRPRAGLRLFYVGGIDHPVYDLSPLLEGVAISRDNGLDVELTLCTRESEWDHRPREYDRWVGAHVNVVHNRTRHELLELYASHDIAVMPYGTLNSEWAMPVKFPEAIGMGLPVLAGAGTAVGRKVAEQEIGWLVSSDAADLYRVLRNIDPTELARARASVVRERPGYSWDRRAEELAAIADEVRSGKNLRAVRL